MYVGIVILDWEGLCNERVRARSCILGPQSRRFLEARHRARRFTRQLTGKSKGLCFSSTGGGAPAFRKRLRSEEVPKMPQR